MGSWTSIALARVSREAISEALRAEGQLWESSTHVTATTTLAAAVCDTHAVGLPIATLLDLVTMPGLSGDMALPVTGFPGPADRAAGNYSEGLKQWQSEATGRRIRIAIQVDDSLRAFVREHAPDAAGRALLASRREYARTVHTLVASGVDPAHLRAGDAVGQLATRAWLKAEKDVPALGAPRDLLWGDLEEVEDQSTPQARNLVSRVRDALRAAFGAQDRWTVVHHGFYFYTPPQWALFQVLRRMPDVDQVFVVHDDGVNPVLSTWRHYFRSDLSMPVPRLHIRQEVVTTAAAALWRSVTGDLVGNAPAVQVRECRSPTELVRLWQEEDMAESSPSPIRYAAAAQDVERYVQRLGGNARQVPPRLTELPVGTFLMALHRCIRQDADGSTSVRFDGDTLMDMVGSGFLESPISDPCAAPAVLRRCLPYFRGCRTGEEWLKRADRLRSSVENRVSPLGANDTCENDLERIKTAAGNPVRLVPWADLSTQEAKAIEVSVRRVVDLVHETSRRERVALRDHLGFVRERLERSLRSLPAQEQAAITARIRGFDVATDDEIDVGGLVDVVAMLLGRSADVDPWDSSEDPQGAVKQLRALDALGLARTSQNLHLANLAEDAYPTVSRPIGWPYALEDLRRSGEAVEPVTVDLLSLRSSTAPLGDLYLFWLALDGVDDERTITLSWVSDHAGERRPLSPVVSLLTIPNARSEAVREVAGGLSVSKVGTPESSAALTQRPNPSTEVVDEPSIDELLARVDPRASASAIACPRRFAIQWAMGPTGSFGPEHQQAMLYGNVTNALSRLKLESEFGAYATTNEVWAHLTDGQKASSIDRAAIRHRARSASPAWLHTLSGSSSGTSKIDRFLQSAKSGTPAKAADVAPDGDQFLPTGTDDPQVCSVCPVQSRCSQRKERPK